jgi:ATP-dependent Clp protease protease subunit
LKINIKGVIVSNDYKWIYDLFDMDATSPKDVDSLLEQSKESEELEVHINSPGGHVDAGSEIYTALKSYKGKVNVQIVGMAASAASVIAMAGDHVEISPTAQIMIHNVSGGVWGDHRAMQKGSEVLKNYNKSIANAYILKTGLDQSELLAMMNKETWFTAQQAKEKGFADTVMFDDAQAPKLVASLASGGMIPQAVVDKLRNELFSQMKIDGKSASAASIISMLSGQVVEPPATPEPENQTLQANFNARQRLLDLKFKEV